MAQSEPLANGGLRLSLQAVAHANIPTFVRTFAGYLASVPCLLWRLSSLPQPVSREQPFAADGHNLP